MTTIKFPAKALALRLELHLFHSRQLVRPQPQAPGLDFPNWAHCLISLEPYGDDPRVWPLLLLLAGELDATEAHFDRLEARFNGWAEQWGEREPLSSATARPFLFGQRQEPIRRWLRLVGRYDWLQRRAWPYLQSGELSPPHFGHYQNLRYTLNAVLWRGVQLGFPGLLRRLWAENRP